MTVKHATPRSYICHHSLDVLAAGRWRKRRKVVVAAAAAAERDAQWPVLSSQRRGQTDRVRGKLSAARLDAVTIDTW